MGSGCEILIAAKLPSSARQLPILAALHARASTLFGHIIHHGEQKVNTFLKIIDNFLSKERLPPGEAFYFLLEMDLDFSCRSRRSVMMELESRKPSGVRCHLPSMPRNA